MSETVEVTRDLMGQTIAPDGSSKWNVESFEDEIAEAIISLYESDLNSSSKKVARAWRLDAGHIRAARACGAYIPSAERLAIPDVYLDGELVRCEIDDRNSELIADRLLGGGYSPETVTLGINFELDAPTSDFCISFSRDNKEKNNGSLSGYRSNVHISRVTSYPKGLIRTGGGNIYRMVRVIPKLDGEVGGHVIHFSLGKDGRICIFDESYKVQVGRKLIQMPMSVTEPVTMFEYAQTAAIALQFNADKRYVWKIEALERDTKVAIGCKRDEVKSLLYARNLPMTETGRKRPILHLVAAHRRRMKSGTEIDIDAFLRGTREVEMNGTLFKVHPPQLP